MEATHSPNIVIRKLWIYRAFSQTSADHNFDDSAQKEQVNFAAHQTEVPHDIAQTIYTIGITFFLCRLSIFCKQCAVFENTESWKQSRRYSRSLH